MTAATLLKRDKTTFYLTGRQPKKKKGYKDGYLQRNSKIAKPAISPMLFNNSDFTWQIFQLIMVTG